jgi:hypothetical protein
MDRETDTEFAIATRPEADHELAVIELAGDDLDAVVHPFDAAERVLAVAS